MNTKGIGALILASLYYVFFRLIWPRISWIFEKGTSQIPDLVQSFIIIILCAQSQNYLKYLTVSKPDFLVEPPVPANWTSVSAAEHFFMRHFDSNKFPGSGNMVTCLKLKMKENVTWSEFNARLKLAASAVQMECPTLQVGAAARHRHTGRVKWYWVRQPEVNNSPNFRSENHCDLAAFS